MNAKTIVITWKEMQTLTAIQVLMRQSGGRSPSLAQIAEYAGMSKSGTHYRVASLVDAGVIIKDPKLHSVIHLPKGVTVSVREKCRCAPKR